MASTIILDIDSPALPIRLAKSKLLREDLNAIIVTSKSHQKEKNGVVCDRYHVILPLLNPINNKEIYKATCKDISKKLFGGEDDSSCHDGARAFFPSPKDAEVILIEGHELVSALEPAKQTEAKQHSEIKLEGGGTVELQSMYVAPFQSYLTRNNHPQIIADVNKSNGTINLYRNKKDINPGNYMYVDDNRIFDNIGNKVSTTDFTFNQINEVEQNKVIDIEKLRKKTQQNTVNNINTNRQYNIILTSEGLGKSVMVPEYRDKLGSERVVLVCKSYVQLQDKKKLYNKFHPDLKVEIIPSVERLLDKYDITTRVYVIDKKTNEKYLSFVESVKTSDIDGSEKTKIFNEKKRYDNIIEGKKHIDIVLMTEAKLQIEVLIKKNFRNESLIIFDEFNTDIWFQNRVATPLEINNKPELIFEQETWAGFHTKMITEKWNWLSMLEGQIIVLSTEEKAKIYFSTFNNCNIIDARNTFYTTDNVSYRSVKSGLLSTKDDKKKKVNLAFLANDYICMGNGINSKLNNVSTLGQNLHGEIDNKKIVLFLTQPCPEEIAPLISNLKIDSDTATLTKMADTANQLIGRHQGFRHQIDITSLDVLIPDNLINKILPKLRYVTTVKRQHIDKSNLVDKIIHTLNHKLLGIKQTAMLYLSSLEDNISRVLANISHNGTAIIECISAFKWFKWSEEDILKGNERANNSNYSRMKYFSSIFSSVEKKKSNSLLNIYSNFSENINSLILSKNMEDVLQVSRL